MPAKMLDVVLHTIHVCTSTGNAGCHGQPVPRHVSAPPDGLLSRVSSSSPVLFLLSELHLGSPCMMPKCFWCNETAPSNPPCPRFLCGKCCDKRPPCAEEIHCKPRRAVRGRRNAAVQARKAWAWKEAHRRCRPLWSCGRSKCISRVLGVSVVELRKATLRALLRQAREELMTETTSDPHVDVPDTPSDLGVAFMVSASQTKQIVQDLVDTEDMHDYLNQGDFDPPDFLCQIGLLTVKPPKKAPLLARLYLQKHPRPRPPVPRPVNGWEQDRARWPRQNLHFPPARLSPRQRQHPRLP